MGTKLTTKQRKELVIAELKNSLGIVFTACKKSGVSRAQFYNWKKSDAKFSAIVKEIEEDQKDFVEGKLIKNINDGDITAIIFYLKTKGKDRGYTQRIEVTGAPGESDPIRIEVIEPKYKDASNQDDQDL